MKTKITYLILNGTNYGGSEKHTLDLINNLSEDKFEVSLICTRGNPIIDSVKPTLKKNCYPVDRGLKNFFKICKLIRELNPDILHLQAARGIVTGRYASLINRFIFGTKYKIISTTHGWVLPHFKIVKLMEWLFLSFRNLDSITLAVSNQSRDELIAKGHKPSKVKAIHNGIDFDPFNQHRFVRTQIKNIGFVGRLTHQKGIEYLLEAIKSLEGSEYHFHIYGDGEYKDQIIAFINSSSQKNVTYHGFVQSDEIGKAYSNIDILLAPSIDEGLPYTFIEAMNCGVPVMATNVGGVPEIVEHGVTGWLLKPKSTESIVSAINDLNSYSIDKISSQAIIKSQDFTLTQMVKKTTTLYLELL
ncbi:MAG: glycosyltransferase family 4 protein [Clostridiales bacterium]|nr:glycosyltransferase family 4 protein [Clostridiales bacterium]